MVMFYVIFCVMFCMFYIMFYEMKFGTTLLYPILIWLLGWESWELSAVFNPDVFYFLHLFIYLFHFFSFCDLIISGWWYATACPGGIHGKNRCTSFIVILRRIPPPHPQCLPHPHPHSHLSSPLSPPSLTQFPSHDALIRRPLARRAETVAPLALSLSTNLFPRGTKEQQDKAGRESKY